MKGEQTSEFVIGEILEYRVDEDFLKDPAMVTRAQETIDLLIRTGIYQFNRWENSDQLSLAIKVLALYTEKVPGFDPFKAGLTGAMLDTLNGLAVLGVDKRTKDDYEDTHPKSRGSVMTKRAYLPILIRAERKALESTIERRNRSQK